VKSPKRKHHQFKHAQRRLRERYDVWIDEKEYEQMILDIQKQKGEFLGYESNSRTHWLINGYLIAVYDKTRKSIATFLPPEAINNYLPRGSFTPHNLKHQD
jgi:hypothetical protein